MGAAWRKAFPDAEASEIRKFLNVFTHAFSFHRRHGLQFAPTDTFMDVYSGIYKHSWMADELESVEFALMLEEAFGKDFPDELAERDPSLGEMFDAMRRESGTRAALTASDPVL